MIGLPIGFSKLDPLPQRLPGWAWVIVERELRMGKKLNLDEVSASDWIEVVKALDYLSARPAILDGGQDEADRLELIAESIQSALDS